MIRVNRIGQPSLLSYLLEQPRAHTTANRVIKQRHGILMISTDLKTRKRQTNMILFCFLAVVFQITKEIWSYNTALLSLVIEVTKILFHQLDNTVIDVASYADHRVFYRVVLAHIFLKVLRLHSLKQLLGS
ncbi:hypothetical protein D3C73_1132250 [compost metagenome]